MTKRNIVAAMLLCALALALAVGFRPRPSSAGQQKPQHASGGPDISLTGVPGVEIESREYVPDPERYGHGVLQVRLKDTTGRKVKAWMLMTVEKNGDVSASTTYSTSLDPFYNQIEVMDDATTYISVAYDDGGVIGKSRAVTKIKESVKRVEDHAAAMAKDRANDLDYR